MEPGSEESLDVGVFNGMCFIFIIYSLLGWAFVPITITLGCFNILSPEDSQVTESINHSKQQISVHMKTFINLPIDVIKIIVYDYMFDQSDGVHHCEKLNAKIKFKSAILCLFMILYIFIGISLYIASFVHIVYNKYLWTEAGIDSRPSFVPSILSHAFLCSGLWFFIK